MQATTSGLSQRPNEVTDHHKSRSSYPINEKLNQMLEYLNHVKVQNDNKLLLVKLIQMHTGR
jgi:hypothetical protein